MADMVPPPMGTTTTTLQVHDERVGRRGVKRGRQKGGGREGQGGRRREVGRREGGARGTRHQRDTRPPPASSAGGSAQWAERAGVEGGRGESGNGPRRSPTTRPEAAFRAAGGRGQTAGDIVLPDALYHPARGLEADGVGRQACGARPPRARAVSKVWTRLGPRPTVGVSPPQTSRERGRTAFFPPSARLACPPPPPNRSDGWTALQSTHGSVLGLQEATRRKKTNHGGSPRNTYLHETGEKERQEEGGFLCKKRRGGRDVTDAEEGRRHAGCVPTTRQAKQQQSKRSPRRVCQYQEEYDTWRV